MMGHLFAIAFDILLLGSVVGLLVYVGREVHR
jgi:hypothetical protein